VRASFILSAPDVSALPDRGLAEVAFAGRSNVGKSSLLNRLAGARIARTSKTPGRTRLLNLFEVETGSSRYALVDLPGYGFADVPHAVRLEWVGMIDRYLQERRKLRAVLLLVDIRRGAQEEDAETFERIVSARGKGMPLIVATKLDKLGKAQKKPAIAKLAEGLGIAAADVCAVSADTSEGIQALRERMLERIGV
jgi:GTP-binding protein